VVEPVRPMLALPAWSGMPAEADAPLEARSQLQPAEAEMLKSHEGNILPVVQSGLHKPE
jgi:hypothetical protein